MACVKFVEVRDVLGGRMIAAVYSPERFQRLPGPLYACGRLAVHVVVSARS
jgi:hypothetical protein